MSTVNMCSAWAGRCVLCLPRNLSIQTVLVTLFFLSVLTNVLILLTSHAHESHIDSDLDPQAMSVDEDTDTWDLPHYDQVARDRGSKLKSLRSLKECIRKKMVGGQSSGDSLSATFVPPTYTAIPPAVDRAMFRSLNLTIQREARRLNSVLKFLSRAVINKHNFHYIHNPKDACLKRQIDLVIAVPSSPEHVESRLRTRQGLKGSYSFVKSNNSTLLFFLGKSGHHNKSSKFQVDINMEMRTFGDIVQETFVDVYHNLTLKTMSVLKWIDSYCPTAQFVIKADDDVGIKPATAVSALRRYRDRYGNFILGRWNPMSLVLRNESAKTYVSYQEYPYATFPPHLLGGAMGFPTTTARLLLQAALRLKPVWLDDVFLSAMCAAKVNVPVFMDADFDFVHKQW